MFYFFQGVWLGSAYILLFGAFGGFTTAYIFSKNQFAMPHHTGAVLPVQPILLLEAGRCHNIPSLATNYFDYNGKLLDPTTMMLSTSDLLSLGNGFYNGKLLDPTNQTWENPKDYFNTDQYGYKERDDPATYCPWCKDSDQCEDLALLTPEAKYQKSHDEYKDRAVDVTTSDWTDTHTRSSNFFCTLNNPYKKEINERPYGCYLDVEKGTWTYVGKINHIVENERYTKTGKKISVKQAECSSKFPCLCTLMNYTNLALPAPSGESGIAASYCSTNANTPQCCQYVLWPLISTCILPFFTVGYLIHWMTVNNNLNYETVFYSHKKKEKYLCGGFAVVVLFQIVGAFWGISILMR